MRIGGARSRVGFDTMVRSSGRGWDSAKRELTNEMITVE